MENKTNIQTTNSKVLAPTNGLIKASRILQIFSIIFGCIGAVIAVLWIMLAAAGNTIMVVQAFNTTPIVKQFENDSLMKYLRLGANLIGAFAIVIAALCATSGTLSTLGKRDVKKSIADISLNGVAFILLLVLGTIMLTLGKDKYDMIFWYQQRSTNEDKKFIDSVAMQWKLDKFMITAGLIFVSFILGATASKWLRNRKLNQFEVGTDASYKTISWAMWIFFIAILAVGMIIAFNKIDIDKTFKDNPEEKHTAYPAFYAGVWAAKASVAILSSTVVLSAAIIALNVVGNLNNIKAKLPQIIIFGLVLVLAMVGAIIMAQTYKDVKVLSYGDVKYLDDTTIRTFIDAKGKVYAGSGLAIGSIWFGGIAGAVFASKSKKAAKAA